MAVLQDLSGTEVRARIRPRWVFPAGANYIVWPRGRHLVPRYTKSLIVIITPERTRVYDLRPIRIG